MTVFYRQINLVSSSNYLHNIRLTLNQNHALITRIHLIYFCILLIGCLSHFTSNHLVFIIPATVCISIAVQQFILDKKELKAALNYARVNVPIRTVMIEFFLLFLIIFNYRDIETIKGVSKIYALLAFFCLTLDSYYSKYIHSLRSFNDGLKLPGRNADLTPWRDVQQMSIHDKKVAVLLQNDLKTLLIDKRDMDEISEIIATWNEKRHNLTNSISN